jgi:chromosome segregation ATPase
MSEARFARIETRLDELSQGQQELRQDVRQLKTDVTELKADVGGLKADVGGLKADVNELKVGQADLRRHMGVLHEEVLDRIQALAFDPAPLRREFQSGIAGLRQELIQRIEPLETAARRKHRR